MSTASLPRRVNIDEAVEIVSVSKSLLQKLTASAEISSVRLGRCRLYDPTVLRQELEDRGRRDRVVGKRAR